PGLAIGIVAGDKLVYAKGFKVTVLEVSKHINAGTARPGDQKALKHGLKPLKRAVNTLGGQANSYRQSIGSMAGWPNQGLGRKSVNCRGGRLGYQKWDVGIFPDTQTFFLS